MAGRVWAAWGLVVLSAVVACESTPSEDDETNAAAGAGRAHDSGGDGAQQAGEANAVSGAGVGGALAEGGGRAVGGCAATWLDNGDAGGEPRLPGCLTLEIPETPFLIQAVPDPGRMVCNFLDDCQIGPWLMAFHTLPNGDLEGALVSTERDQWPLDHGLEAAEFQLHQESGVFRLPAKSRATLATYDYDDDRVPGVCLTGRGLVWRGSDRSSTFTFFDDSGDGIADGVTLRGDVLGLGQRGGDYEDNCGDESFPLATQGRLVDTPVRFNAEPNVLQPRLIADGGFLRGGSARLSGPQGWVDAEPLTLSGFTYGYAANVVLQPGALLDWKFDAVDWYARKLEGELAFGPSEWWLQVHDGGFESYAGGEEWGTEDARIEASCNPSRLFPFESELPPIAGNRSLVIDAEGYRDRFRFTRTGTETQLSFVAFGSVGVELTTVGALDGPPLQQTPLGTAADCEKYAAFCAAVPAGALKQYSLPLPDGDADVLVRLYNQDKTAWASSGGSDLCVDDLGLE